MCQQMLFAGQLFSCSEGTLLADLSTTVVLEGFLHTPLSDPFHIISSSFAFSSRAMAVKTIVLLIVAALSLLFHYQYKNSVVVPVNEITSRKPNTGGIGYSVTTGYRGDKEDHVGAVRSIPETTCALEKRDPIIEQIDELIANGTLPEDWHQYARSCVCGGQTKFFPVHLNCCYSVAASCIVSEDCIGYPNPCKNFACNTCSKCFFVSCKMNYRHVASWHLYCHQQNRRNLVQ